MYRNINYSQRNNQNNNSNNNQNINSNVVPNNTSDGNPSNSSDNMNNNTNNIFQSNPAFHNLSPEKLSFLMNFANTQKPVQMQEMMPFLMSSMNQAKKENIQFTPSETDLLIEVLKQSLSTEEAKKIDMAMNLMRRKK